MLGEWLDSMNLKSFSKLKKFLQSSLSQCPSQGEHWSCRHQAGHAQLWVAPRNIPAAVPGAPQCWVFYPCCMEGPTAWQRMDPMCHPCHDPGGHQQGKVQWAVCTTQAAILPQTPDEMEKQLGSDSKQQCLLYLSQNQHKRLMGERENSDVQ